MVYFRRIGFDRPYYDEMEFYPRVVAVEREPERNGGISNMTILYYMIILLVGILIMKQLMSRN